MALAHQQIKQDSSTMSDIDDLPPEPRDDYDGGEKLQRGGSRSRRERSRSRDRCEPLSERRVAASSVGSRLRAVWPSEHA